MMSDASAPRPAGEDPESAAEANELAGGTDAAAPEATERKPFLRRLFSSGPKLDKESLAKLGSSFVLSYGFVSNMNAGLLIIISWVTFRRANPLLSPLNAAASLGPVPVPSPTPQFLLVYGGYYATIGNLLRPVRFALATALSPAFTRSVKYLREKGGMNRALAIATVVFIANIVGTCVLIVGGVRLACLLAQVPVFPPK